MCNEFFPSCVPQSCLLSLLYAIIRSPFIGNYSYIVHMKKDKKSLQISLLADRVLIEPESAKGEEKTATGIIVPKKDTDTKMEKGVVVAVGMGRKTNDGTRIPLDVTVGDHVYFKRGYDVEEVLLSGTTYILLSESNVYAIID
jgi:chaperonin GroES